MNTQEAKFESLSPSIELDDDDLDAVSGGKSGFGAVFGSIFGGALIGTLIGQAIGSAGEPGPDAA